MCVGMVTELINMSFIGHLGNASMLAGVGLGNMTQNIVGLSLIIGFNSVLDTFISQSVGAGMLEECGVYVNRARFVMTLLFIPILLIIANSESILVRLGQDA